MTKSIRIDFYEYLKTKNIYNASFLKRMKEAQDDIKKGRVKEYTTENFLNSLDAN